MKVYRRTQFGNPILRKKAKKLNKKEILSSDIQTLIKDMYYTLENKKYGVGLAGPQINKDVAIAVIGLKPTPTRPEIPKLSMVIINPVITKLYDEAVGMWEACISGSELYGKAMRHNKIQLSWTDEKTLTHSETFKGLVAQVLQHEVDHLNGVLFVDRVSDPKTYITFSEYKKIRKAEKLTKSN